MNIKRVIITALSAFVLVVGGTATGMSLYNATKPIPTTVVETPIIETPPMEEDVYEKLEEQLPSNRDLSELGTKTRESVDRATDYTVEHAPEWIDKGKEVAEDGVDYMKTYGPGAIDKLKGYGVDIKDSFENWATN